MSIGINARFHYGNEDIVLDWAEEVPSLLQLLSEEQQRQIQHIPNLSQFVVAKPTSLDTRPA